MYTLTFGTPTVDIDSATLPFTINQALGSYPYHGNVSATGGGETKRGEVTIAANSATGEIVFTGLSAETEYTIAPGRIEVMYMGDDKYLEHEGISFTTATDEPKVATESQWQDLAAKVKAAVPPMIVVNTSTFPTSSTPGVVGQLHYVNYGNHYLYVCTSSENGVTKWQQIQLISGGSGD